MESFYVTSTQLDIEMATEPHPSGLVIFSKELSSKEGPIGHIIVSPENEPLLSERESWGISVNQNSSQSDVAPNYFTRVEPAYWNMHTPVRQYA